LMFAARNGHTATVRLLLDRGAYFQATGQRGETALVLAAEQKKFDALDLLSIAGKEASGPVSEDEEE
jgi:ankyrin repeat protein